MIIGERFAWGHIGKTGGDATLALFQIFPELIEYADARRSRAKHAKFRERDEQVRGKLLVLNMRRLPAWMLSFAQHRARHGLYPDYTPLPLWTADEMAECSVADAELQAFTDDGRFTIDVWLRTEYLRWDFLSFVSTIATVSEQQLKQVLELPMVNATEYEHDIDHWFTASQLERMYARNPVWAALEAQLYADGSAPVVGQTDPPFQQRIQALVQQHIAPQRDVVELWRRGGVVHPTARDRAAETAATNSAGVSRAIPEQRPTYPTWKYVVPLPPAELLQHIGAPDIERFFVVGDAWAQLLTKFIASDASVLEIGCGCGRIARFLLNLPDLRYAGVDSVEAQIAWCAAHITPLSTGRFQFHHMAGLAAGDPSDGPVAASAHRFPAADASVDLVVATSVCAHRQERDVLRLLRETGRILTYGGHALLGVRSEPHAGISSGSGSRRELDPNAFVGMAERCGLTLKEQIGNVCAADVVLFEKAINWSPVP